MPCRADNGNDISLNISLTKAYFLSTKISAYDIFQQNLTWNKERRKTSDECQNNFLFTYFAGASRS